MKPKNIFLRILTNTVAFAIALVVVLGAGIGVVQATLVGNSGVIAAPAVIADDTPGATNERQEAFDERQHITLTEDIMCSNGVVQAGETVNSHMIFYNTPFLSPETDANREWEFDGEVVCVMAERSGLHQGTTDSIFGAIGTQYPGPFASRGLETDGTDSYEINGNTLTVTMTAEEPGDWIRVLTKVTVPEDTTPPTAFCEAAEKKGNGPDRTFTLIGADDVDGTVDLYLTDTVTETEFGPYAPGTVITHGIAKGATPSEREVKNDNADYSIKSQGELIISATDEAGNGAEASCTGE